MSQSPVPLPFELVLDDDVHVDSHWHAVQSRFLIEQIYQVMKERGGQDFFTASYIFVYHSVEQARDVAMGLPYLQGPDFFYVGGVPQRKARKVAWEEEGRLPDVIVELASPATAHIDRTVKKDLYARTFRTPEYYIYDMDTVELEGFRLAGDDYRPIAPNASQRLPCKQLGLELGLWRGEHKGADITWLRFFHPDGRLVATPAEAERQRADAAEAEVARLRSLLAQQGGQDS